MSCGAVRVIKLGGSLLAWPEWPRALRAWLAAQPPASNLLIVGGGTRVDAVRQLDRTTNLPASEAHWLAIGAMSRSARQAAEQLPEARIVYRPQDVQSRAWLQILDVQAFMEADRGGANPLPEDWRTTSDSIAARVASRICASELVLLKSAPPGEGANLAELSAAGYVDPWFPIAAAGLAVRLIGLRNEKANLASGSPE